MVCLLVASLHLTPVGPAGRRLVRERVGRVSHRKSCFGRILKMLSSRKFWNFVPVLALSLFLLPTLTFAQYTRTDLVTDSGVGGTVADPHLVNGWGLTALPGSPWWVSDNVTGLSTLYTINNSAQAISATPRGLVVTIPAANGGLGSPTGVVANTTGGFNFTVNGVTNSFLFIFSTFDGIISAWNPAIDPVTIDPVSKDRVS